MMKTPYFHGGIRTKEAERRLKEHGNDCFLIRYSNDNKLSVMLSNVRWRKYKHFTVNITKVGSEEKYCIEGREKYFSETVL